MGDAPELYALIEDNREHLARWMWWAAQDFDATLGFLESARTDAERGHALQLVVLRDERIAGMVGFHRIAWAHRSASLGYWLAASEQGRGLMTAAVGVLVGHAFSAWELNRLEIQVAVQNHRSRAIAQRLGFREEGLLREAWIVGDRLFDLVVYAMLARDWRHTM